jgi:hypothetical protein
VLLLALTASSCAPLASTLGRAHPPSPVLPSLAYAQAVAHLEYTRLLDLDRRAFRSMPTVTELQRFWESSGAIVSRHVLTVETERSAFRRPFVNVSFIPVAYQAPDAATGVTVTAKPATPTITLLNPSSGAVGTSVTITGSGFNAIQGSGTVTFNGAAANVTSWSPTSVTVTVPAVATTGNVLVFQNGVLSAGVAFTVTGAGASNPISASRLPAADTSIPNGTWAGAGRTGGIPTFAQRPRCTTGTAAAGDLAASSTAVQINTAITGCDANHAVILATGAFTLSAGINLSTANVTLRGQGAGLTTLDINGSGSCSGIFFSAALRICGDTNTGCTASCGGGSGPDHSATWATGYAQGSATITLSAVTGLVVGQTIYLDQNNHNTDGYPSAGDTYFCEGGPPCSAEGSGAAYYRDGKSQVEYHQVVGCRNGSGETAGAACTSTTVVISPGVLNPTIRSGQSPGAWWNNSDLVGVGLEDLSIDFTGQQVGVELFNVKQAYVRGVRIMTTSSSGTQTFHLLPIQTTLSTFESNYIYGPTVQGNTQYAYTPTGSGQLLFQNNILQFNVTPIAPNDPDSGSVYGYNYVRESFYSSYGPQHHNTGDMYNLHEGNNYGNVTLDINHGPHHFQTYFRNFLNGAVNQVTAVYEAGAMFAVNSRFVNMVGNVIGGTSSGYSGYENNLGLPAGNEIYVLGTKTPCSFCTTLTPDANVKRTLLRWGNYDSVTAGTRWCVAPLPANCGTGAGGSGTPQNEVPSAIANYPNAVPSSQTLPPSLYLSAAPSWFTFMGVPWPPIGPDVTGGPSLGVGGHAYKIPARVCYESLSDDAAFPSSSPRIKSFNRVTCYGA